MNEDESKKSFSFNNDYHLKGLAKFGGYLFSGFLVWCALHCPMSNNMQSWFFAWAVAAWLFA